MKETNELIAEFMERPWRPVQAGYDLKSSFTSIDKDFKTRSECLEYCDDINAGKDPSLCFFPMPKPVGMDFELHYHEQWDWLMPVVISCETLATEKINELSDGPFGIDDPKSWRAWDYRRVRLSSNIDETYKQVVSFIEWCNKTKVND